MPNSKTLTAAGFVIVGLSLVSLGYFAAVFDVSVPTAALSASLPAAARDLVPTRVANLERMNQRQNGIIASSAGVVVGVLIGLFGWNGDNRPVVGQPRVVGNSLECPACRLLNPASAERCDCGHRFGTP